jgi:hypothetical protein
MSCGEGVRRVGQGAPVEHQRHRERGQDRDRSIRDRVHGAANRTRPSRTGGACLRVRAHARGSDAHRRSPPAAGRCRPRGRPPASRPPRAPGRAQHLDDEFGVDVALADVVVPVGARVERVARVVGVDQVDPAGDGLHPVDDAEQSSPPAWAWQVSRQKPASNSPHDVPQPGQRVEPAGARVVAAGGVLDQDRQREAAAVLGVANVLRQLSKPASMSPPGPRDRRVRSAPSRRSRPPPGRAGAAACGWGCGCGCSSWPR